jgi:hypothetical protein
LVGDRVKRLLVVAVVAVVAVIALGSTGADAASSGAATRGEARAAFQAWFTGGSAIRAHNALAQGVPAGRGDARIYAGAEEDLEYCQHGWHVIMAGVFDDPAFFAGGNKGLFDYLASVDIQFELDGVSLETERTAIKRLTHPNPAFVDEAFAVNFGAFLSPGSLSVGPHTIHTTAIDPLYGDFEFDTPFTVVSC